MKTYLVSDIHGQYQVFRQILAEAHFSPDAGDRLYVLGDIVDRGPQSRECLLWLYELQQKYPRQIVVIKGNHEQLLEDWLLGKTEGAQYFLYGGEATIRSFLRDTPLRRSFLHHAPPREAQEEARQAIRSHDPFLLPYLQSLPLYREEMPDGETGAPAVIFVHAGVRPGRSLSQQSPVDLLWIREEFYNQYAGDATVVFGHTPVTLLPGYAGQGIWQREKMIGIDGGAGFWRGLLLVEWPSLQTRYLPVTAAASAPAIHLFPHRSSI